MPTKQVGRERISQGRGQHDLRHVGGLEGGHAAKRERGESSQVRIPVLQLVEPQAVDDMSAVPGEKQGQSLGLLGGYAEVVLAGWGSAARGERRFMSESGGMDEVRGVAHAGGMESVYAFQGVRAHAQA